MGGFWGGFGRPWAILGGFLEGLGRFWAILGGSKQGKLVIKTRIRKRTRFGVVLQWVWGRFLQGLGISWRILGASGVLLDVLGTSWDSWASVRYFLTCWKSLEIFLVRIAKDHACHSSLIQPLCPKSKRLDFLSILHVGRLRVDRLRTDLEENLFSVILAELRKK